MPSDRFAARVLDYLARVNGSGPVSRSQLLDTVKVDGMDRKRSWEVVEGLHADGLLEIVKVATSGRPRLDVKLP